ncbi:LuxR C-terminal-related transcriptional regulator [Maribacter sp. MAR_2009_72]|uniref:helix-turn-helix and ligand-binding sensor domain-containing protein n=1 Tax=Maribacter sp. MAR_2009_72 TaxID=1250050 RepID=UPI00119A7CF0|nr:LuxR C-terminal-related transcriptional regulator [Maribacter sp. MAR_2009_72]TVZ14081.1 regulatory LuxR family protein [Maribacter sp. MAR_2009_72]
MKTSLLFIILMYMFPFWSIGQNLSPPIQHYSSYEYNAASKNWGITMDNNGELYVANNNGLLHFNGENWTLNKLPNKTIIRSTAYVDGKIFTGSYEEFGYWKMNAYGSLEYTSLTHLITDHEFTNEEFWQIIQLDNAIIFRSFSTIYLYKDNDIQVLDAPFVVTNIAKHNGQIIVAGEQRKLFYIKDNELAPYVSHDILEGKTIIDMVSFGENLLIGTKLNGCFLLVNGQVQVLDDSINKELKEHQLNKVLVIDQNTLAFGTIKNGIYTYNIKHNTFQNLNKALGLQNNTVLAMLQFKEQLWLGLDNGLDKIQLKNPITYYTDHSGVLGTVYDLVDHNGQLYLGSNTGIYYFKENQLQFVPGSQGHVWDLEIIDGDLFCGHNTGTFILKNGKLTKVSDISGGYQIAKVPETRSSYIQGTYTGLASFKKNENGDWITSRVSGIDFPVKQFCFENATNIWAAHPYKGLFKIKMDNTHTKVLSFTEIKTGSIPNTYNIKLYNIKNQIVLSSEGNWYKYDPISDVILEFDEFKEFKNMDLVNYNASNYWFFDNDNQKKIIHTDLIDNQFTLDDAQLRKRLAIETKTIVNYNDSIYYFTLTDGFGKLNLNQFENELKNVELPTPRLSSFKDENTTYTITNSNFKIPYNQSKSLGINFSAGSFKQYTYYYELKGAIDQSSYLDNGSINLQNLTFGEYILQIHTVSIGNELSAPRIIDFKILRPWYFSNWSLFGYLVLIIAGILLVRWYNRQKLAKKHNLLKIKMQREQDERLAQMEKEKLEKEIKRKQTELARTTMSVAKKNELILEFKDLIALNQEAFSNKQRFRSLSKKLDSSMNEDQDWKHFEVSFKELHEDFFENLLKKYPKLTPKDLRLCAYLKMNHTTKEIAPLMGISIRGVEIHRYRLRKKLNIDSSQNLSNYLIKFK